MYAKVTKIIEIVLIVVGVALAVFGFAYGFETADGLATDVLFYCAYALAAIAILGVVGLGLYFSIKQNPKVLIKLGVGLVAAAAIIGIAYLLAPGTEAVGTLVQSTPQELKLTDTILNITYFFCGGAVLAIIVGAIVNAVRK